MRLILSLLLLLTCHCALVFAQDNKYQAIIKPGEGIGEITIGRKGIEISQILGVPPVRKSTYDEEKEALIKRNLDPKTELVFFLGFDIVVEYNISTNKTEYPIYSLYFKDGKLIYIILSSYGYDTKKCKSFGIDSKLYFGDSPEKVKQVLGSSSYRTATRSGDALSDYFSKGISVFSASKEVRTMHIYAPLDRSQIRKYLAASHSR